MAQTQAQAMQKIRSMMKATREAVLKEAEHILSTGAIELDEADNDFRIPKMVLMVAMKNAVDDWAASYWTKAEKRTMRAVSRR